MSSFSPVAYQLGCQCAADVFEKQAAGMSDALRAATRVVDTGGASAARQTAKATARKGARRGAAAVTEEAAAPGAAQGLWNQFLGSPAAQYTAAGAGGAGIGAVAGGEDNRLRGAMMGAGLGLGGVAGVHLGRLGQLPRAAQRHLTPETLQRGAQRGSAILAAAGGLGGLIAGRGLAPGHQAPEKPWLERARGLIPF